MKQIGSPRAIPRFSILRAVARITLGVFLFFAGVSHLTTNRQAFRAQVPEWVPLNTDFVVLASGVVEILLGLALIALPRHRVIVGWVAAAFFIAIFPGNISQLVTHTDSFGLNTDLDRSVRLVFQPVLVLWALWSTGAWFAWRAHRRAQNIRTHNSGTETGGSVSRNTD